MAKQDGMEQAKEVLRQVIKYRFWISVSIAALFAVIAYVMGSAPVKAKTLAETANITSAESAVKKFQSLSVPTASYKPIVEEKTQTVGKDVNKAWKELYDRQAPLLTWPATANRFAAWGRKWPETEDVARVQLAYVDYTYAYPGYVDMVYKTFHPFDYETGEGIVAAPLRDALLRPVLFSVEDRPDLGKVWAAQERLWIQHTVLDVIAQVNKNAKDWDSAIVKEINVLEVGNPMAQDQKSLANAEELKKADEILAPGQTSESAEASSPVAGGMAGGGGGRESMMGGMAAMAGRGAGAMSGGAGSSGGAKYDNSIYYITPANDKNQYKILPILVTVLIDQDHVQDFLVELENSPMSIQVMDFELARPSSRVTKPEKGNPPAGGGGMMGMMGGMQGMMRGMMGNGQSGYGGMMGQMNEQMRMQMGRMGGMGGMPGMGGMMGMGGMTSTKPERKGTDIRSKNTKADREKVSKEMEEKKGTTMFDPHFDIVEVTVYGRARFFLAPPAEAADESSLGQTPTAATAPAGAANPAAPGEKADAEKPAAPAAGTKAPAGVAAPKADAEKPAPKADAEKPAPEADAERPAPKAAKPDGNGAAPKS